ncbi:MAG: GntR family transcriptional regulator [Kiritimatiellae bacterium]|nr:GntR family transcriptional regulator [Kiritimatiellia bacterium]
MSRKTTECGFAIDRSSARSLVDQVYKGMRERIFAGRIKIGSAVPSLRALADELGVSVKVTKAAYGRLVRDGWLRAVPRAGYLAVTPEMPKCQARVLLVLPNEGFFSDYVAHRLQERCEKAGIQVSRVIVPDPEDVPVSLDIALSDRFDLAVSFHFKKRVIDALDESGVPFVLAAGDGCAASRCRNCVGRLRVADDVAGEVAEFCARRGVRTAELVDFHVVKRPYAAAFRRAGIAVREWTVPCANETLWYEDIPRGVMRAFLQRLKSQRPALPDLFFFLDDYVAKGALMALATSGVRIPEDVKVLTFANRGNGPVYVKDLARIEQDPIARGDAVADFVVSWLNGGRDAPQAMPPPVFIHGETI